MRATWRVLAAGRRAWWRLGIAVLAGVGAAAAAVGLTATSAWLISRAAEQPPVLYLLVAIVAVRAFGVGRGALRYAERLAAHDAAFRVLADLRVRVYARLERLAPAGLAELRSGDLLVRLVGDVDDLADLWLRVVQPYAVMLIIAAGAVLFIGWLSPAVGLVLLLTLVVAAVGAPLMAGLMARIAERSLVPARGELATATLELLHGAPEILVSGAADVRLAAIHALGERLRRAEARSALGAGTAALVAGLAGGLAVWLALIVGVGAVRDGALAGVALAVVVLTPIAVHELVSGVGPAAQHLFRQAVAAARVVDVLDRPDPIRAPAPPVSAPAFAPAEVPIGKLGLRIRDLSAGYPGGPDVLRHISLDLPSGEWALVTGPSGSGKTTLASVLVRFLDPRGGSVDLVGAGSVVSLNALGEDDARGAIGLAAQDVHVFDTTIEQNLRLARPGVDDAALADAVRTAGLATWVATLPEGLATPVGEHGARLSGGQRQRIGLARAVLADRPIMLYDEPTEHLDPRTAEQLTGDLLRAASGRTTIFITHRPELIAALDQHRPGGLHRLDLPGPPPV